MTASHHARDDDYWKQFINKELTVEEFEEVVRNIYTEDYHLTYNYSYVKKSNLVPDTMKVNSFCEIFKGGERVLVGGCSGGQVVQLLVERGFDAWGADPSDLGEEHLYPKARGRFKRGSLHNLPFEDGSFDVLMTSDVLEHIAWNILIKECKEEILRIGVKYQYHVIGCGEPGSPGTGIVGHINQHPFEWWRDCFKPEFEYVQGGVGIAEGMLYRRVI